MNAPLGMPPAGGPNQTPGMNLWSEARNPEGRVYYYNKVTKATQWTKPVELMSPSERALADQPWQEYSTKEGRKYWSHKETKQSTWEMPEVYKAALAQQPPPNLPNLGPAAPQFVAGGTANLSNYQRDNFESRAPPNRQTGYAAHESNGPLRPPASAAAPASNNEPEYSTFEEAEIAFMKLLRRSNIQADASWEDTIRATIKDPQYRALKDPRDRKAAFEKYVVEVRSQERDRAKERLAKLRVDFATMLRSHSEIKHYTRWKTARPIIEGETIFRSTSDDTERRQLFEEHIIDLKREHDEYRALARKSARENLGDILQSLELEPYTRWADAQENIHSHKRFQEDKRFQTLTKSEVLSAFEEHVKELERAFNDKRQREKHSRARRERQNRDRFIDLLHEHRRAGKILAGSKWKDVRPLLQDDARYQAMLGQSGSGPLDLFWDMLESEERDLRAKRNDVYDVLEDRRFEIDTTTTFDAFHGLMMDDKRTAMLSSDTLRILFDRIVAKVRRREEEDKHAAERHQRHMIDALRSRIKHLDRPLVTTSSTWEEIRPRIERFDEYKAIDDESLRVIAFEKVIRRLKEKEDRDKDRYRAKDEDRDKSRDQVGTSRRRGSQTDRSHRHDGSLDGHGHDRRHRSGRDGDRHRDRYQGSPTPELDAYEADRRKAMAARERNYRHSGPTSRPLSPSHSNSHGHDPTSRSRRSQARPGRGHSREHDRLNDEDRASHRSRADPRAPRDELDYDQDREYGSTGPLGTSRRRRDSDEVSAGSLRKRPRRRDERDLARDHRTSRGDRLPLVSDGQTHEDAKDAHDTAMDEERKKKEEVAVHSGSEEGEMVEED